MGKVLSIISKQAKSFNIENRAHKIISMDKPIPAPRYPANIQELERISKEHPEIIEESSKKDAPFQSRLKQVYVLSHDPEVTSKRTTKNDESDDRPLPLSRFSPRDPEFGFVEPRNIPKGKFTLRQALKFITDHQADPKTWNVEKIAEEHSLNKNSTENVLKYFHTFEVYIPQLPQGEKNRNLMAEPSNVKKLKEPEK